MNEETKITLTLAEVTWLKNLIADQVIYAAVRQAQPRRAMATNITRKLGV